MDSVIQPQEIVEADGLSGIVRIVPNLSSADNVNPNLDNVNAIVDNVNINADNVRILRWIA